MAGAYQVVHRRNGFCLWGKGPPEAPTTLSPSKKAESRSKGKGQTRQREWALTEGEEFARGKKGDSWEPLRQSIGRGGAVKAAGWLMGLKRLEVVPQGYFSLTTPPPHVSLPSLFFHHADVAT